MLREDREGFLAERLFGVAREAALAASVVFNVLLVVPTVLLGLPGLRRAGGVLRERLAPR